ncbi:MAG: hypothetical protein HY675_26965 [Chloroflexi bacterium]|nr:hypothetical protein [Chloroflexota bacterium]
MRLFSRVTAFWCKMQEWKTTNPLSLDREGEGRVRVCWNGGGQQGMTLLELTIGLGIGAMLVTVLASVVSLSIWLPAQQGDKLTVVQDLLFAQHWIASDAGSATSFATGTSPEYGSLGWSDYTGAAQVDHVVIYSYDAASGYLMRSERRDGSTYATFAVAKNIADEDDVVFSWNPSTYSFGVALTSTVATGTAKEGITSTVKSTSLTLAVRPREEQLVSPPGIDPIPTPPPGSRPYYVAEAPVVLTGTYVSGSYPELQSADGAYYAVDSTTGGDKQAVYTVRSQSLTVPSTISQLQVRFTGQSSKDNTSIAFYVKNSDAGFPASSEYSFTFADNDTSQTVAFNVSSSALSYISSQPDRRLELKISASGNSAFTLSTDQIAFIASP